MKTENNRTIQVKSVSKNIDYENILKNVTFNLHKGEIFALVGETQSGKSLLTKILLDIANKDTGKVIFGDNNLIGYYLPQENFMKKAGVLEIIADFCNLNGISLNMNRVKNHFKIFGLSKVIKSKIEQLSSYQIAKLKLAIPLIAKTNVLVLDTPFSSFNAEDSNEIKMILKTLADKMGVSILITSKHMQVVEEICDTLAIIDHGEIIALDSYNNFINKDPKNVKIAIKTTTPNRAAQIIDEELKFVVKVVADEVIVNTPPANAQKIADALLKRNITILTVRKIRRSLQEEYFRIIQNRKRYF
jgi:ABC-2 type transport system ATP-binding protein